MSPPLLRVYTLFMPTDETPDIECAVFHLRKTTRTITQLYDEVLRPTGLRSTQYSILRIVSNLGPFTVNELGTTMGMDRTTVTRNVRLLERMGHLRIEPGDDRRTRRVRLSARGRSAVEKTQPYWEQAQAILVGGLGDKRWQKLRNELTAIVNVGRKELDKRADTR